MPKDISTYIRQDEMPPKEKKLQGGITRLVGRQFTVNGWEPKTSSFRNRGCGIYYALHIEMDGERYCVNASGEVIERELRLIAERKQEAGDDDMSFEATAVQTTLGIALYSPQWN